MVRSPGSRRRARAADGAPLFAKLSASPIAAASLSQVYRGTLADGGAEVAVKVQRPSARRQILLDAAAIYAVYALTERASLVGDIDLLKILDLVFSEVVRELDLQRGDERRGVRALAHAPRLRDGAAGGAGPCHRQVDRH